MLIAAALEFLCATIMIFILQQRASSETKVPRDLDGGAEIRLSAKTEAERSGALKSVFACALNGLKWDVLVRFEEQASLSKRIQLCSLPISLSLSFSIQLRA